MTPPWLLAACGAAGVVLLVAFLIVHDRAATPGRRVAATGASWLALLVALIFFDFSIPSLVNSYYWQIIIKVGIYVTLAVSLNVINGIAGQFSMGHAGFMAVGAYTTAYLTMMLGAGAGGWMRWLPWNGPWSAFAGSRALATLPWGLGGHVVFLISLVAGGIAAATAGYLVGIPSLRLKGDYLAIVTLGFGEIMRNLIANVDVIGASRGLPAVPHYSNLFWVFIFAAFSVFVSYRLLATGPGRAMLAVREDEVAAAAMGIDTTRTKILAFAIGTFFAGVAGGLLAHHQEYLHPDYFKFDKSFEVIIMVVLGGMGSVSGAVVSAIVIAIAPEALRYVKDLLGSLTEPSVLFGAAPFILFAVIFLALFAIDVSRMIARGARGLLTTMRIRSGERLDHADIVRLRREGGRAATSLLTDRVGRTRPARSAGLGALAGLCLGIAHRAFLGSGWEPRVEYTALVLAGLALGFLIGRRKSSREPSPGGPRRLATVGLLAPFGIALALLLERAAPAFLDRVSVFFRAFPDPRMVLYSLMLIVLMLTRPTGLFGTSEIRTWWRERRRRSGEMA